jgi:hypothetical protein
MRCSKQVLACVTARSGTMQRRCLGRADAQICSSKAAYPRRLDDQQDRSDEQLKRDRRQPTDGDAPYGDEAGRA